MGKIIEFKKFSNKINKDNLLIDSNIDVFPENELLYIRKEINIKLHEVDEVLSCIYKQILINNKLINKWQNDYDLDKLIYLKDFNDKLHDVMYFLTNSIYGESILIKLNFLEFKYLVGTLQLQLEILKDSNKNSQNNSLLNSFNLLKELYSRLSLLYASWQKEVSLKHESH